MTDDQRFSIDRKGRQILAQHVVSRRQVGSITEADVAILVTEANVRFFINRERDSLYEIAGDGIADFWEAELRDHIANNEDACLAHFDGGYMYFAELWKGHHGQKIVVFHYQH